MLEVRQVISHRINMLRSLLYARDSVVQHLTRLISCRNQRKYGSGEANSFSHSEEAQFLAGEIDNKLNGNRYLIKTEIDKKQMMLFETEERPIGNVVVAY